MEVIQSSRGFYAAYATNERNTVLTIRLVNLQEYLRLFTFALGVPQHRKLRPGYGERDCAAWLQHRHQLAQHRTIQHVYSVTDEPDDRYKLAE